jgi:integrase
MSTLTEAKVKNLASKDKPYRVFDGRGDGLYLEVLPSGSKKWRLIYRNDGRYKSITLGTYPYTGLKEARDKAFDQKRLLESGKDPLAERHQERPSIFTFAQLVQDWQKRQFSKWDQKTQKKKQLHLTNYILPALGCLPVNEITSAVVLNKLLRPIEERGRIETAHRLKMLCSQIFRYGVASSQAERDPTQDLRGALTPVNTSRRATILDPNRIGELLNAIDLYNGFVVVRYALKLAPLLFVRPGELRQAEWSEIDWDDAMWRIPAEKMKKVKIAIPHFVPLSRQALEMLRELQTVTGNNKWVFPGQRANGRPMSDMAMNVALRTLGFSKEDICAHGFRSMASTILNEQGYNRDWIERQLAHTERDGVRAAYNYAEYLPERRKMMQDWADHLDGLKNTHKSAI